MVAGNTAPGNESMPFKTLFVPMAFEETARTITDAALLMADAFGGHVIAHHVRQRYAA